MKRRSFLIGSAAVAGGVVIGGVLGVARYRALRENPLLDDLADGEASLTPYVRIDADGVTVIAPRAEMGQGVHTTLAALVAEELDVSLDDIRIEHGPPSAAYANAGVLEEGMPFRAIDDGWMADATRAFMTLPATFLGMQLTGGSSSVRDAWEPMREAGAIARRALVEAAALEFDADAESLRTERGEVIASDGRRMSYSELAPAVAGRPLPDAPPLKPRDEWRLLGRSQPRVDVAAKCDGSAIYSIDVSQPGMRFAAVRLDPGFGSAPLRVDAAAAKALPGVEAIVPVDGGVAVVAGNTWQAMRACQALDIDWAAPSHPMDSDAMRAEVAASFTDDRRDSRLRDDGDVDDALAGDDDQLGDVEYAVPYLAHATMEPPNAVARVDDDAVEVWVGTQAPTQVVKEAEAITGIDADRITVHTTLMGGGFGRRAEMDYVRQTLQVATALRGTPIKLTWSRENDVRHDVYRPMAMGRARGRVTDGRIEALDLSVACSSVFASQMGRIGVPTMGPDVTSVQGAWDQPYALPHYRVTGYRVPPMLPVGSWRSIGNTQNGFFHECAVDELAHAAGIDPLQLRLSSIDHEPSLRVLEAIGELSGWHEPLPPGRGRGLAFVLSFGVPTAEVIEVSDTPDGIRIDRAFAVVDVGIALDPRNIEAQVQGGLLFGLSAAIGGEITVANGAVQQSNFHDVDTLRIDRAPRVVEVRVLENGSRIRGIGEPGTPPAAPALANAIFAATGRRVRELPLKRAVRFA